MARGKSIWLDGVQATALLAEIVNEDTRKGGKKHHFQINHCGTDVEVSSDPATMRFFQQRVEEKGWSYSPSF